MNAIFAYLFDAMPEIALALIIGFVAWKISKRLTVTDTHFTKVDDSINALQHDLSSIKKDVNDVQLFITSRYPTALNTFASKNSPLTLNELGEKLYTDCGGDSFIAANQVMLLNKMEERHPKTALDVETVAKEVLLSLTNNEIFNTLKLWVYNSPSWKVDGKDYTISLGDVCFVLSIPLRDVYLELHKEIAK